MKTMLRVLPLIAFVALLLVFRLVSCQPVESETTTTTTSALTTSCELTTASVPTTVGEPTTVSEPTFTTAVTAAPTTTMTPATNTTAETSPPVTNNERLDWFFIPPATLNKDIPSTIPSSVIKMISKYNVIWQAPAGQKLVYLTMDMGYEYNNNTARILNTAKAKGVPITFFITGDYLERNADLVKRMVAEGHLVGNHTYDHPNLVDMMNNAGEAGFLADLGKLETEYKKLTGQELTKAFRPSSGIYSEMILDSLNRHGYRTYFWSFAYVDWLTADQPNPATAKAKILGQLHDGEIMLLHAVSNTNTDLLPELIDEIRARGYEFGRVDQIH